MQKFHSPLPSTHKCIAAGHTQCSGPTRPCVIGHRRRQSNTGQARMCISLAKQQHTSTQRALRHTPLPFTCALGQTSQPLPSGNSASTAHCPQAVGQCIARVPLPTAPRQRGSALHELRCPLPPGRGAVCRRSSTAHCPGQGGSVLQEMPGPLPQGREAVYGRSTTPHCPQAMRQCEAGFSLPTSLKRRGSALHCPLPCAHNNSVARHTQCSAVHRTKQCGTKQKALMVQGALDQ